MESSTREIFVHILIRDVWILEKRAEESYCGRFGLLESTIEYKVRFRKRGWERGGEKENKEGKEEEKIKQIARDMKKMIKNVYIILKLSIN